MHPDAPYFCILLCLMLDDFTCQVKNATTQWVNLYHILESCPSSVQYKDRRLTICEQIKNFVVAQEDDCTSIVKQSDLLSLLNLTDNDKSLLTRCVKVCFPHSTKKKNHQNQ